MLPWEWAVKTLTDSREYWIVTVRSVPAWHGKGIAQLLLETAEAEICAFAGYAQHHPASGTGGTVLS